jgi:hypothetical protein
MNAPSVAGPFAELTALSGIPEPALLGATIFCRRMPSAEEEYIPATRVLV